MLPASRPPVPHRGRIGGSRPDSWVCTRNSTRFPCMHEFKIGQAAELIGVSPDTVRRWADAGELPTRRTESGQRLIDGAALAAYAAEHAPAPDAASIVGQSARN